MKKIIMIFIISALLTSCLKADNKYIHPSFTITAEELDSTLVNLNKEIAVKIKSDRKDFLEKLLSLTEIHDDLLILTDRSHSLDENSIPSDLIELDNYNVKVNKKGMKLRKPAFEALMKMNKDMADNGLEVMISSAYRSYKYQEKIYNYYVSVYGQEETDKFSARPGTSQHQLGTAVDFGSISEKYAETPEGLWMLKNASAYGFSLSFPKGYDDVTGYNYEPWHYRYITTEGCIMQKTYFSDIQQYMLEYLDMYIDFYRGKRAASE